MNYLTRAAAEWTWVRYLRPAAKDRLIRLVSLVPLGTDAVPREYRRALFHYLIRQVLRPFGDYIPIVIYQKNLREPLSPVVSRIPVQIREATERDIIQM